MKLTQKSSACLFSMAVILGVAGMIVSASLAMAAATGPDVTSLTTDQQLAIRGGWKPCAGGDDCDDCKCGGGL
ncbi:MAG: hypothetical protein ACIAXF_16670, partial [Phycisphaerales bacterium JB063]